MNRIKTTSRKQFTKEEKEFIRLTTNGRCAHCGKKLSIDECTVEHIIPLNKGGTNDHVNLIVLCETCNKAKDDLIADPIMYYPYISDLYTDSVQQMFEDYIKNVNYIDCHNILYVDLINKVYPSSKESEAKIVQSLNKAEKLEMGKYAGKGYTRNKSVWGKNSVIYAMSKYSFQKSVCLKKAKYKDLDEIWNIMWSKGGYTKQTAKEKLSWVFSNYSVYSIKKGLNTVGYFFVVPRKLTRDKDVYIMCIEDIYCKYYKYYTEVCQLVLGFASLFMEKVNLKHSNIAFLSKDFDMARGIYRKILDSYSLREKYVIETVKGSYNKGYYTFSATFDCPSIMYYLYNPDTEYQDWIRSLFISEGSLESDCLYDTLSNAVSLIIRHLQSSDHFLNINY